MRASCVLLLMLVLVPAASSAQSFTPSVSMHAAAGPTMIDAGYHLSGAVGFSPLSRMTLLVDVERTRLLSRYEGSARSSSSFRGGTMTSVSGEVRVGLFPPDRATPYIVAGLGAGVSRPTVNETFRDRVSNDVRFVFAGGGLSVPLQERVSIFGDARMVLGDERGELLAMVPVRLGITWRF